MFWKFSGNAFLVLKRFCSSETDRVTNFCLSSAVDSCYHRNGWNSMLEAFYDKTCLSKCVGNSLEMIFEYLNISVAQKLTELQILSSNLWKTYFFGKMIFWSTGFGQLILLPTHLFRQLIFGNSLFCLPNFLTNWFFYIFLTADFLQLIKLFNCST